MKTRLTLCLLLMMPGISISTMAQPVITREANHPRAGDVLIQQEVEYQDPGKPEKDAVWNFSRLIPVEKKKGVFTGTFDNILPNEDLSKYLQVITSSDVEVSYLTGNDGHTLRGLENGYINNYNSGGDSLLIGNWECPSTRMESILPQVFLTYPFAYKNKITNYYSSYGVYCDRMGVKLMGSIETEADGYGMLILPGNDTIRNVLRVKIVKTALEEKESSYEKKNGKEWKVKGDSIAALIKLYKKELPTTEIVRWYAEGYRYPVLEMIYGYTDSGGNKKADETRRAFFYDPVQQDVDYLSSDTVNHTIATKKNQSSMKVEASSQAEPILFDYNLYPNPVGSDLTVDMHFSEKTTVRFSLFTVSHLLVYQSVKESPKGHSTVHIPMSGLQKGQYLLHISCGEKTAAEKIIKK